jgi:hypothetical protein
MLHWLNEVCTLLATPVALLVMLFGAVCVGWVELAGRKRGAERARKLDEFQARLREHELADAEDRRAAARHAAAMREHELADAEDRRAAARHAAAMREHELADALERRRWATERDEARRRVEAAAGAETR